MHRKVVSLLGKKIPLLMVVVFLIPNMTLGYVAGWLGARQQIKDYLAENGSEARQEIILEESQVVGQIAKDVGESVVSVNVIGKTIDRDYFGNKQIFEQEGAGTGFIISSEGIVITNRHVVPAGTSDVSVTLSDGTQLTDVEVIGRTNASDPLDIAFLRIKDTKGKTLKAVTLGDSSKVEVGDKVVAIGNALGQFQNSVTSGIISGYGRTVQASETDGTNVETLQNLFQTDTAINQGNSGGPLVNINGQVIGINTAVAAGGAENIGFAIPINDAQSLIKSVLVKGQLLRPYLGVRYVTLTDDIAYELNLSVTRGAYLAPRQSGSAIIAGSPADKAGLREKDIIIKAGEQAVDEKNSLISVLGKYSVGDKVTLTIVRDGSEQKIDVTLEAAPTQ